MAETLESNLLNKTNCTFGTFFENDLKKISQHYQIFRLLIGLIMSFISLSAISGNFIVLLAMITNKQLRTVSNMFILSLSISDFCIGFFVMPLSATYMLLDKWIWGRHVCFSWLSIDYTASTASILNLLALSFERMISISDPLKYIHYKTKSNARIFILFVWLISSLWLLPININFWGIDINNSSATSNHSLYIECIKENTDISSQCFTHFETKYTFKMIATLFNFYIPLTGVILIYSKIFMSIRERSKSKMGEYYLQSELKRSKTDKNLNQCVQSDPSNYSLMKFEVNDKTISSNHVCKITIMPNNGVDTNGNLAPNSSYSDQTIGDANISEYNKEDLSETNNINKCLYDSDTELRKSFNIPKSEIDKNLISIRLKQQRRAAKKLGILVLAFLITWMPYSITFMVIAFCPECISTNLYSTTIWLGYLNSSINPILYPLCSHSFRTAFRQMFGFNSKKNKHKKKFTDQNQKITNYLSKT